MNGVQFLLLTFSLILIEVINTLLIGWTDWSSRNNGWLCTWWIHSAVPAGKRVCLSPCDGCNPTGGWCGRLKIRSLLGNFQPAHSIKGSSEPFASSARGFSGFCLSFVQFLNISCSKNKNFSPLMPINCLINCLVNFWTFRAFRVPKQINGFLMNQFMNINVSKRGRSQQEMFLH